MLIFNGMMQTGAMFDIHQVETEIELFIGGYYVCDFDANQFQSALKAKRKDADLETDTLLGILIPDGHLIEIKYGESTGWIKINGVCLLKDFKVSKRAVYQIFNPRPF